MLSFSLKKLLCYTINFCLRWHVSIVVRLAVCPSLTRGATVTNALLRGVVVFKRQDSPRQRNEQSLRRLGCSIYAY
jgi:hypothetical protein